MSSTSPSGRIVLRGGNQVDNKGHDSPTNRRIQNHPRRRSTHGICPSSAVSDETGTSKYSPGEGHRTRVGRPKKARCFFESSFISPPPHSPPGAAAAADPAAEAPGDREEEAEEQAAPAALAAEVEPEPELETAVPAPLRDGTPVPAYSRTQASYASVGPQKKARNQTERETGAV